MIQCSKPAATLARDAILHCLGQWYGLLPSNGIECQAVDVQNRSLTIRGLLGECGMVLGLGDARVRGSLPRIVEDAENGLCDPMRALLGELHDELAVSDERLKHLDVQVKQHAQSYPGARRIQHLEGVGHDGGLGGGEQHRGWPTVQEWARVCGVVRDRAGSTLERTSLGGSASGVTAVFSRR